MLNLTRDRENALLTISSAQNNSVLRVLAALMFPSTALFHEIDCSFLRWGLCNRPYCLYNHGKDNTSGVTTTGK